MDRAYSGPAAQGEDLLRQLASAVNAVRLYPPTSPLRLQAIDRFTRAANAITSGSGPMQYYVDRQRFILAEAPVGEGSPQVGALAETLHALQVAQLIIAPGLAPQEVERFLDVLGADAHMVRSSGGLRKALLEGDVDNIAVIEVTLRASSEEGLLGLDLTTAPTDDIARELQAAVSNWSDAADRGDETADTVSEAIGRLEPAARDLAMRRCAEALLLLDEATRTQMLSASVGAGPMGINMDGMLEVVAHMQPSALARLLRLTAATLGTQPDSLLGQIELPPELQAEIEALLRPSARTEEQSGVPAETDAVAIVADVAAEDEDDLAYIARMVTATTPRAAAARGLETTLQVARERRTEDAVKAIAEAIEPAVREGALAPVAAAGTFLRQLTDDPRLAQAASNARMILHERPLLEMCARRLAEDPDLDAARHLLEDAGNAGAEALVVAFLESTELRRKNLAPTMNAMIESVAPIAGRVLRTGDSEAAIAILSLLGAVASRRLASTIATGLDHADARVREAALTALANSPGPESAQVLQKALGHANADTRRIAAREIGRARREDCLPALLKIIGEMSMFERNYELKREVLNSLELLHSPKAVPALKRLASRRISIDKRNRELRDIARRVLRTLE